MAVLVGALVWLLVGCSGLLWTIAFTTDAGSMTVGLAVWVFCFVVPSTLATVIAYQLEEPPPADGVEQRPSGRYAAGD